MSEMVDHLGPYEVLGELGRGAMARVWRAKDPRLGREVAIKEPLLDEGLAPEIREEMASRFVKEAHTVAALNHPNIVTIYAADVYDGRPVIVMELVEGAKLSQMLEMGPLAPQLALEALDQLLDAVGYAHGKGVVHRDIKPDNIFVSADGRVKLSDFGIARATTSSTRSTVAGTVLGTPGYMSPEQARGALVDARSDLFSVGVVAYEMLSGRNPFGAGDGSDAVTLLYRIVHEPVPELPADICMGLPADMRPAIMAALEKDPVYRPQSAEAFKAMLHGANVDELPVPPHPQPPPRKTPKWIPYAVAAAACVAVLAIGVNAMNAMSGQGRGPANVVPAASSATESSSAGSASSGSTATSSSSSSGSAASVGSTASEVTSSVSSAVSTSSSAVSTTSVSNKYYLAESGGYVAVFSSDTAALIHTTDLPVSDLTAEDAQEVGRRVEYVSVAEADNRVNGYRVAAEQAKRDAAQAEADRIAAEQAEQKAREEEAARQAREAQARQKAAQVVAGMDGWWHADFQGDAYGYVEGGSFTVYRPDYPSGNFYRTIAADDLEWKENGMPGHFEGVPGYFIPKAREGDKNYYITEADLNDNGKIDTISHINDDGSGYVDSETFHRAKKPDYAQ